jgi:hypothetical protein
MLKKPIFETRNAPCEIYAALQAFERSGNTWSQSRAFSMQTNMSGDEVQPTP